MRSEKLTKDSLRQSALARRDALSASDRAAAVDVVTQRSFPVEINQDAIVSGYAAMKSEFKPVPLMRKLSDAGASLALPVVTRRGEPLIMRAWDFGDEMASGVWGIREPKASSPEVLPDILLVPLAAFDRNGHRIGYGAGYYDRTIPRFVPPAVAIAVAFDYQIIAEVPVTEGDVAVNAVVTDTRSLQIT